MDRIADPREVGYVALAGGYPTSELTCGRGWSKTAFKDPGAENSVLKALTSVNQPFQDFEIMKVDEVLIQGLTCQRSSCKFHNFG